MSNGRSPPDESMDLDAEEEVFIQTSFDLLEHMKKMAALHEPVNNPFIPPAGCPINQLPPEILSYIFTLGTAMDAEGEDEEEEDIETVSDIENMEHPAEHQFQTLVSHVCTQWREVAIQTPGLWASIDFLEGPPFERSRTWIARSKGATLEISIDCTRPDKDEEDDEEEDKEEEDDQDDSASDNSFTPITLDNLSTMLSLVIPHVGRWRTFEFMVNDYHFMHLALTQLSACPSAPLLEMLELYHYEDFSAQDDVFMPVELREPFILFHGNAPKISQVSLWGVHLAWSSSPFLSGLEDLELAYHAKDVRPSFADFARILRESPEIRTLAVSASGPAGEPADWHPEGESWEPIELPSMKNLVLAYLETSYVSALMKSISVPNLTDLALDFDNDDQSDFILQLTKPAPGKTKSLLSNIEHLKIAGLQCSRAMMNEMFAALSSLRSFNVNVDHADEALFCKLAHPIAVNVARPHDCPLAAESTADPSTPMYCPNLEIVTTTGVDGPWMRAFLEARKKANVPIKRVYMNEEDDVASDVEDWIRSNVESVEFFEGSDDESDDEVEVIEIGDDL